MRLSHLTLRQIQIELFRFGRRRVHEHHALSQLIEELMNRPAEVTERNKFIRALVIRDALYLSHVAGLHGHCAELFLSTMAQLPKALALSDVVVDSAFAHGSAAVLSAIVDAAATRFQHYPDDALTEAALYRLVWLCALKSLELDAEQALLHNGRGGGSNGSGTQRRAARHQEILDLQEKHAQYETVARDAFAALCKANRNLASIAPSALHFTSNHNKSSDRSEQVNVASEGSSDQASSPFYRLWDSATRFARYHYAEDGGEAHYYKYLYDGNWLRHRHSPQTVTVLIRSCGKSQNTKLTKEYFSEFVAHVMEHAAAAATDASATPTTTATDQKDVEENPTVSPAAKGQQAKFQEIVVHTYFQTLVNSRAYQEVVDAAESLFTTVESYQPSTSILAVVARAAGEVRNHQLAMHCASLLFSSAQKEVHHQSLSQGADDGGADFPASSLRSHALVVDPAMIDASDSSVMSATRDEQQQRGLPSNYEVFVTLVALAKCHATSFLPLLERVGTIASICPNDEETLCLRLHYLRRSPHILSETNQILDSIRAKPIASVSLLSVRNMTLILLLLQHCNHDAFMETFRDYNKRSTERRQLWCIILLQWAEQRRYSLSPSDRDAIIRVLRDTITAVEANGTNSSPHNGSRHRSTTSSMWHSVTSWMQPSGGDSALQRGAVAVFLADCCVLGKLTRAEAFASAHGAAMVSASSSSSPSHVAHAGDHDDTSHLLPQWPLDDASLRFTLKPSRLLSAGLRRDDIVANSLLSYHSTDLTSGLSTSLVDLQLGQQGWAEEEEVPQQANWSREEKLSSAVAAREMVRSIQSLMM